MDGLLFDTEALYQQAFVEAARLGGYDVSVDVIRLAMSSRKSLRNANPTSCAAGGSSHDMGAA
jgi:beta-phosphoglucomutase-like phosphatase (HAD superfamily)